MPQIPATPSPATLSPATLVPATLSLGALTLALALTGCGDPPFAPGSDLPAESPPAVLSDAPPPADAPAPPPPAPDLDPTAPLDGDYALAAALQSPLGDTIDARFIARLTQRGAGEGAPLDIELADPHDPDAPGPRATAPLDPDRAFHATLTGLTIDPRFSDLLVAPAAGEVTLDGRPVAPDCLAGRLDLTLIDARVTLVDGPISLSLQGTFTAERTPGACP